MYCNKPSHRWFVLLRVCVSVCTLESWACMKGQMKRICGGEERSEAGVKQLCNHNPGKPQELNCGPRPAVTYIIYYRTVTRAHMAHLLHILMSLLKTCRSLSRICRRTARTLLERNSSPCNGFGTCAFEIIGAGWRCFVPSEAIFTNIKAPVAGVIFVLALFAAMLWISLSHTWKQTVFLKADTLPASFIIYAGLEKHFTVNYPPAAPPKRCSVSFIPPFVATVFTPPTTGKPTQSLIHLSHFFAVLTFCYPSQSCCLRPWCTVLFWVFFSVWGKKQNKLQMMNCLWQIIWFETAFRVQGTTYAPPFSHSRLCLLSNGVGGSQWLLVIQREAACHYAFVWDLRSHKVWELSILDSLWFVCNHELEKTTYILRWRLIFRNEDDPGFTNHCDQWTTAEMSSQTSARKVCNTTNYKEIYRLLSQLISSVWTHFGKWLKEADVHLYIYD